MRNHYTLRGNVLEPNSAKLVFESPQANTGWIVDYFVVWPYNMDSNLYTAGKLVKGGVTIISFDALSTITSIVMGHVPV